MGVWHIGGLGISPGAVTIPLTYVYLLLKQATLGDKKAQDFFAASGGQSAGGLRGLPEALVLFTSKEVADGQRQGKIVDKWFGTKQKRSAPETIRSYLVKLLESLKDTKFSPSAGDNWIKHFYIILVNHQDFDDCFSKILITLNALRDKEIWVNMVGGTNQINAALLAAGGFTAAATRNYYIFQNNIDLLHPDIERPNFQEPRLLIPPSGWYELPFFTIDMSQLYEQLTQLFQTKPKASIAEIRNLMQNLKLPEQLLVKIRGTFIRAANHNSVTKGPMLEYWEKKWQSLKAQSGTITNMSAWENWGQQHKVLLQLQLF